MKRFLLSLVLILGLVTTPFLTFAAQPAATDISFESSLSGDVIDLGTSGAITFLPDSYELSQGRSVSEEYIWFTYNWSNFQLVIVDGDVSVADYYDLTMGNMVEFYEEFEVIEEDIGADHGWFLANARYQGTEMAVFYDYQLDALGEFDLLVMQFAPADTLISDLALVRLEVTISGQPFLPNINPREIKAALSGTATGTGEGDPGSNRGSGPGSSVNERLGRAEDPVSDGASTPEATETGRTTRTTRTTRAAGTEDATATETTSTSTRATRTTRSTGSTPTTSTTGGNWESLGLVSDTEWVSPHFQTSVVWDGAMWFFPAENDNAIYIADDGETDMIFLESVDGFGRGNVRIADAGTLIPADLVDFWSSPNLMKGPNNEDVVVVDIRETRDVAAVVYQYVDENGETVNIIEIIWFPDDGTMIGVGIVSAPENASTVYGQFIDGVQVNSESVGSLLIYTPEDIADLAG